MRHAVETVQILNGLDTLDTTPPVPDGRKRTNGANSILARLLLRVSAAIQGGTMSTQSTADLHPSPARRARRPNQRARRHDLEDTPEHADPSAANRADVAWVMGMAAGCARGLVAGRRRALETVLAARFGPLEADASDQVAGLEPDVLDQRLRDAARAPDLDAFWAPG